MQKYRVNIHNVTEMYQKVKYNVIYLKYLTLVTILLQKNASTGFSYCSCNMSVTFVLYSDFW
ncbi:hypothetical protein LMI01_13770 [Companilactobacillus mindensis]|nr:hypothetical protein LMI01_13770 [Companilactobacillus mindensis]